MKVFKIAVLFFLSRAFLFADGSAVLKCIIDWEKMEISFEAALAIDKAGLRLPQERSAAAAELERQFKILAAPEIESLPVNSSSVINSLVEESFLDAAFTDNFVENVKGIPPYLSADFSEIRSSYILNMEELSTKLPKRQRPAFFAASLMPEQPSSYTGIIVIANEELPVHGKRGAALPEPCFSPKLWDEDMNLLYDRSSGTVSKGFRYMSAKHIFSTRPGGLSVEAEAIAGKNPLKIFASGVFGIRPSDLILQKEDALKIISSSVNRRLLTEGKFIIILPDNKLKSEIILR